jgi:hypothetical protein
MDPSYANEILGRGTGLAVLYGSKILAVVSDCNLYKSFYSEEEQHKSDQYHCT